MLTHQDDVLLLATNLLEARVSRQARSPSRQQLSPCTTNERGTSYKRSSALLQRQRLPNEQHLSAQTKSIVLLTFPAVTEKMQALAKRYANVFVFEKTQTVFDTIELIKHSKMVVSPDTAIVHIASGLHKPTVAFYSLDEENFVHWQPNNSAKTQIIRFDKSVNEVDFKQVKANLA